MIDVSELMSDPDFAQTIIIRRVPPGSGFKNEGEWREADRVPIEITAIIQPASSEDLTEFNLEGTELKGGIRIWADQELHVHEDDEKRNDIIIWNRSEYHVIARKPWKDFGYWKALAIL
jgi:hypothetical protein